MVFLIQTRSYIHSQASIYTYKIFHLTLRVIRYNQYYSIMLDEDLFQNLWDLFTVMFFFLAFPLIFRVLQIDKIIQSDNSSMKCFACLFKDRR